MASATGGGEGKAGRAKRSLSLLRQIVVNGTCENVHVLTYSCAAHIDLCNTRMPNFARQNSDCASGSRLRLPLWSQRAFLSQRDEEHIERRAAPGSSSSLKQPTHHPLSNTITFVLIHEHESTYAAIIKRSAFVCV